MVKALEGVELDHPGHLRDTGVFTVCLQSCGTKDNDGFWLDHIYLMGQVIFASLDLTLGGSAVRWWSAFDYVCNVDIIETDQLKHLTKHLTTLANERNPMFFFGLPRSLTYKHHLRLLNVTLSEDRLGFLRKIAVGTSSPVNQ